MADCPRVMLVSTMAWPSVARLALAFAESGFSVSVLAPSHNPVHFLESSVDARTLPLFGQASAFARTASATSPDLVIPCDEPALELTRHLTSFHRLTSSRGALGELALAAGLSMPVSAEISSSAALRGWLKTHPLPCVLKTDSSWGGRGTRICETQATAEQAFRKLSRPPSWMRVIKRFLLNRDVHLLQTRLSARSTIVTVQAYVPGRTANIAVASWEGEVLAVVSLLATQLSQPTGPATIVRRIDDPDMVEAARAVARGWSLSGLFGLDFVVDDAGRAQLIELNPRATPTAHLAFGEGQDLTTALRRCFPGPLPAPRAVTSILETVALFPQEAIRDPDAQLPGHIHLDEPTDSPELLAHGWRQIVRSRRSPLRRLRRALRHMPMRASGYLDHQSSEPG